MPNYTICLIGHTGYIGSHFVGFLQDKDHAPFLVGRPGKPTKPMVGCECSHVWNSSTELSARLQEVKNPIMISLAGLFISNHNSMDLDDLIDANFSYPLTIFEALSALECPRVVNIGTSWEYTDQGEECPANLYAQLKSCNSATIKWYANNYNFCVINLKINDTFGGDDKRSKLMPYRKRSISSNFIPKVKYSEQLINLYHINEVFDGVLHAAERTIVLKYGEIETVFLLGKETITIRELTEKIIQIVGNNFAPEFIAEYSKDGPLQRTWKDAPHLKNWYPKLSIDDGLRNYFGKL